MGTICVSRSLPPRSEIGPGHYAGIWVVSPEVIARQTPTTILLKPMGESCISRYSIIVEDDIALSSFCAASRVVKPGVEVSVSPRCERGEQRINSAATLIWVASSWRVDVHYYYYVCDFSRPRRLFFISLSSCIFVAYRR